MKSKSDLVIGNKYVVISAMGSSFNVGDVVTYIYDDGTNSPKFEDKNGVQQYLCASALKDYVKKPKVTHDRSATLTNDNYISDVRLTLRGEGTSCHELVVAGVRGDSIEAIAYVNANSLRAIAKQLKKWAKGLEQGN